MRRSPNLLSLLVFSCMLWISPSMLTAATTITQHGITWTFDKDYPTGQQNMWDEYREQCGLVWRPSNASAVSP